MKLLQGGEGFTVAVTIKDVSARCGLSVSTVSKAFNNYSDISAETRELVQRTAREIGYYPNAIARTLKTNRSYNLGVVFADDARSGLLHGFFAAVLEAFKSEGERRGYDITFINHNVGWSGMTYLEHCRYRNVDGVCIVCADFYAQEVTALVAGDIPCVTIDHSFNNRSSVMSENLIGQQELVRYAWQCGHRKIAFAHGQHSSVTESRLLGYYWGLSEQHAEPRSDYVIETRYDNPAAGCAAVEKLMTLPDPPTCILMSDDNSALGAWEAAEKLGLRIPQDVSIAGYDGIRLTQIMRPRLTTIRQDTETMGRSAADCLIERIENPRTTVARSVMVPGRLIRGETIVPPAEGR